MNPNRRFAPETASARLLGAREEQQDRVAVFHSGGEFLLALADGLGGHESGAQAAQAVVDAAARLFSARETPPASDPKKLLLDIVLQAHCRMQSGAENAISRPGSTCVLLHLTRSRATWAHVGDSRLYRFRDGRLKGRTLDHSVVELLRLKGKIEEAQMKTHPDKNRLLEALGVAAPPEAECDAAPVAPAAGFLLCSDGLWENTTEKQLEKAMRAANLQAGIDRLARQAQANGAAACDNISIAAVRLPGATRRDPVSRFLPAWRRQ